MDKKVQEIVESSMVIQMTEEDAKRFLKVYNRVLQKNWSKKAQELWRFWEKNIDELAKWFVQMRCEEILNDEQSDW